MSKNSQNKCQIPSPIRLTVTWLVFISITSPIFLLTHARMSKHFKRGDTHEKGTHKRIKRIKSSCKGC